MNKVMQKWISSPSVKEKICFAASRSGEIAHPFPANLPAAGKTAVLSCSLSFACAAPEQERALTAGGPPQFLWHKFSQKTLPFLTKTSNFSSLLPFIHHPKHKKCIMFFFRNETGTKAGEKALQKTLM